MRNCFLMFSLKRKNSHSSELCRKIMKNLLCKFRLSELFKEKHVLSGQFLLKRINFCSSEVNSYSSEGIFAQAKIFRLSYFLLFFFFSFLFFFLFCLLIVLRYEIIFLLSYFYKIFRLLYF